MERCIVCGGEITGAIPSFCDQCGWDFEQDVTGGLHLEEIPGSAKEEFKKNLETARKVWTERLNTLRKAEEERKAAERRRDEKKKRTIEEETERQKTISRLLNGGKAFLRERNYRRAIDAFERLLLLDPESEEARELLFKSRKAQEENELQDIRKATGTINRRFLAKGESVEDTQTGLIWARSVGPICESVSEAKEYLRRFGEAEPVHWRIPNRLEVMSLLDNTQKKPALPSGHPFQDLMRGSEKQYYKRALFANFTDHEYNSVDLEGGTISSLHTEQGPEFRFPTHSIHPYTWPVRGKMSFRAKARVIKTKYLGMAIFLYGLLLLLEIVVGLISLFVEGVPVIKWRNLPYDLLYVLTFNAIGLVGVTAFFVTLNWSSFLYRRAKGRL